jgi:hypothetical protein
MIPSSGDLVSAAMAPGTGARRRGAWSRARASAGGRDDSSAPVTGERDGPRAACAATGSGLGAPTCPPCTTLGIVANAWSTSFSNAGDGDVASNVSGPATR